MARSTIVTVLCGAGAGVLLAVGGCGGAVEEAADAGAVAQPADEGASPADGGRTGDTDGSGTDGGATERPGQPGGEVSAGGAGGRPGVPFDQPVFQQIGMDFDEDTRRGIEDTCAGVCTVAYSVTGDPHDASLACRISAFSYDPPPSGVFFQAGAEVTVHVTCEAPQTADGEVPEGEDLEGENSEGSTTDEGETTDEEIDEETDEETSDAEDVVPADETAG